MSIEVIRESLLHNTTGTSDKLYLIQLRKVDTAGTITYEVIGFSGRNGSNLNRQPKINGVTQGRADTEFEKVYKQKTGDGYVVSTISPVPGLPAGEPTLGNPVSGGVPAASTSTATAIVGVLPMLPKDADLDRATELLEDNDWAVQKKYDGERVVIELSRKSIVATNRKGIRRDLPQRTVDLLKPLLAEADFANDRISVLDGELVGEEYFAFDIITLRDNDEFRAVSFEERYGALSALLKNHPHLLGVAYFGTDAKQAVFKKAYAENWEGLIFRHLDAPYESARSTGVLRHKLWTMATCRVSSVNAKRSVKISMLDSEEDEVEVGNVTIPPNQELPALDSLIEVRYLYATAGNQLYQPVFHGVRSDKDEADTISSLRPAPPEKRTNAELKEAA